MIYLNPNANNIKAIFSHELTHVLERTDSYQTLRNMVLSRYGNNTALQNALDAKRKNYQAHGVELTRAEAAQELVAEFAGERLFTDISAIRRLASYDLNLAGKIGSAISRMASKATGNPEKSFLRNAEHMYTQAIRENSGLSPTEARFLLESNGYSVEKTSELGEISNRERIEKIAGNDIIDTKKRGRGINVEIDTFTPCLRDVKTGEIVDTEYSIIDPAERKGLKRKGWMFNWNSRDLDNSQIYKLTTRGSTELQGLVAIEDNPRSHAFHLSLVESAAQNRNNGTPKKYEGAGGHLFAIAAKKSFEAGYGGFVYFEAANMSLVKHYQKEFGAILVGMPHEYSMILNEEAAQKLLNIYTFRE